MHETRGKSDDWHTPKYIFDAMGVHFDLDVAAPAAGPMHTPATQWYSHSSLDHNWWGFIWMNPPFGHQSTKREWLSKFFAHGNGVALLPDRTSAPWWQEYAPQADTILFVSPKIKFERLNGSVGEQPGTGTVLLAAGSSGLKALITAKSLGQIFIPFDALMHFTPDPESIWAEPALLLG